MVVTRIYLDKRVLTLLSIVLVVYFGVEPRNTFNTLSLLSLVHIIPGFLWKGIFVLVKDFIFLLNPYLSPYKNYSVVLYLQDNLFLTRSIPLFHFLLSKFYFT